ncbi:MAG: hypothetical protein Q7U73_02540 [Rubrivivax sp.]|nr:hypothetical protein [Rubrivivax sp.]
MSKSLSVLSFAVALAATLTACGGGGGADTAAPAPTPTPPPPATSVTLTGIAARGAALAGAAVNIKCAGGSGSATTSVSGAYTVAITSASLPCAFQVTGTDGTVLHSLRAGTENTGSFNVNITPLTELVVASAAATAPATFFSGYAAASAPNAAAVTQAIASVRTALASVTIDLSGVNPISDTLVAASAGTAGNALDQKIDALGAALTAAQTTLAQLSTALVANPTSSAPVATILQPVAGGCAWLRSGKYRMINPSEPDPLWRAHVLDLNAATLKATLFDGSVVTFTDAGSCKFTTEDAQERTTVVVSSAGVLMVQSQSKTNAADVNVTVGLPEQSLPVADFAGTWNVAIWQSASGTSLTDVYAETLEITLNSSGAITSLSACEGLSACVVEPGNAGTITVSATDGGFNLVDQGTVVGRFFLFKNAAGRPVFVGAMNEDGSTLVGTPKQSVGALPTVGAVSQFRELSLRGNDTVDLWVDQSSTVTAVDAATRSVTRMRASDSRVDTLGFDKPRDGLRYRAANSCTTNGSPTNCAQTAQIPLQGMGITLSLSVGLTMPPSQSFFNISVGKPGN